ncbi:MAG TPA: hypothetical protein VGO93_31260 [Candidatus Xenobia bacterium]|jgi:hypothetical protein
MKPDRVPDQINTESTERTTGVGELIRCSAEGCDQRATSKGMCPRHYQQFKKAAQDAAVQEIVRSCCGSTESVRMGRGVRIICLGSRPCEDCGLTLNPRQGYHRSWNGDVFCRDRINCRNQRWGRPDKPTLDPHLATSNATADDLSAAMDRLKSTMDRIEGKTPGPRPPEAPVKAPSTGTQAGPVVPTPPVPPLSDPLAFEAGRAIGRAEGRAEVQQPKMATYQKFESISVRLETWFQPSKDDRKAVNIVDLRAFRIRRAGPGWGEISDSNVVSCNNAATLWQCHVKDTNEIVFLTDHRTGGKWDLLAPEGRFR